MRRLFSKFISTFWGKLILGLIFFALIGVCNALRRVPKLRVEVRKATVAEVFDTWEHYKGHIYGYYFYRVDNKYYYGGCTGNRRNLKDLKDYEIRKFPVIYNIEDPEYHMFLSDYLLSDTFDIGQKLVDRFVPDEQLFQTIALGTAPVAEENEEKLKEYLQKKIKWEERKPKNGG